MSQHDPEAYLLDMAHYASQAVEYAQNFTEEGLKSDPMRTYAIIYALQTVGEAARRLGREYRETHPELAWAQIIGFRNLVIHDYDKVNIGRLLAIIHDDVPRLLRFISEHVPPSSDFEAPENK